MDIRPIDVMRSQEVTQIKHVESQRSQHEQAQISAQFQNHIQHEKAKVVQTANSENKEYRYDEKKNGNNSNLNSKNKKKNKEKDGKKKPEGPLKPGGGIDILI